MAGTLEKQRKDQWSYLLSLVNHSLHPGTRVTRNNVLISSFYHMEGLEAYQDSGKGLQIPGAGASQKVGGLWTTHGHSKSMGITARLRLPQSGLGTRTLKPGRQTDGGKDSHYLLGYAHL